MLTDSELSAMRSTVEESLPDTAVIQTSGWVSDGGGGGDTGWTNAGTIDCRIAPISGREDETGERITSESHFILTFPHDTQIDTNSRVLVAGGTFNVETVRDRSWNTSTRVEAVKES